MKLTLDIPPQLHEKIVSHIEGTSYQGIEDFILKKLYAQFPDEPVYTPQEEKRIKERLRRLGYIE